MLVGLLIQHGAIPASLQHWLLKPIQQTGAAHTPPPSVTHGKPLQAAYLRFYQR
jgi:hypothetical protein